ncbi:hypothetical protein GCM10025866_27190 [Naasia aerilata]|uniref:Uncharacterized protein n=1 Tax=Naasia aerilata TaxID=1162966 RepID=A0ABN6XP79_9MICO|nr:hypothetical protein GCM10025866_27190 [Naasia aerilata]
MAVPGRGDRAPADQARALQHLEMLRDGRLAHVEGLRKFGDGRVAQCEALQDGAAGGIRERGEDVVQAIGGGARHRDSLHNRQVLKYATAAFSPPEAIRPPSGALLRSR